LSLDDFDRQTLKLQSPDAQSELNVHAMPFPSCFWPDDFDRQTLKLQSPDAQSELNVHAMPFASPRCGPGLLSPFEPEPPPDDVPLPGVPCFCAGTCADVTATGDPVGAVGATAALGSVGWVALAAEDDAGSPFIVGSRFASPPEKRSLSLSHGPSCRSAIENHRIVFIGVPRRTEGHERSPLRASEVGRYVG
jgi:hypothetical protein